MALIKKGMGKVREAFDKCSKQSDTPMFLMLGLDKAGKTTLLYRLKCKGWDEVEMVEDMRVMREWSKKTPEGKESTEEETAIVEAGAEAAEEDVVEIAPDDSGYHYEEFQRLYSLGIWEIPGSEAMRHVWSTIYRTIKIHGVFFVVNADDASDADPASEGAARIDLARRLLHALMNEDELRLAAFAVIINLRMDPPPEQLKNKDKANEIRAKHQELRDSVLVGKQLFYRLGLHTVHKQVSDRLRDFTMDVLTIHETHKQWTTVLEHMRVTLKNPLVSYGLKF